MTARKQGSSARAPERTRRARGSLSQEEILAAARQLVERDGLQPLSFPRLAKELGAAPTSLYWYFRSKDELLAALVDEVTREMYLRLPPMGGGPWDEEIVEYHATFRSLLQSSPVYREVFAYRAQTLFLRSRMAPFIMRSLEDDLGVFVRAGLTPDEAAKAFNVFSVYTRAFALVEQGIDEDQIDPDALALVHFALAKLAADLPAVGSLENLDRMFLLDDDLYRSGLRRLVAGFRAVYPALGQDATNRRRPRAKKALA